MNKISTYEQELTRSGELIYTTSGRSMRPFLRSGEDLVVIKRKTAERCRKYDAVLYRRDNGAYVLHRIVRVMPNSYTLCGDNCCDLEPGIRDDQILGVLTTVIRNGKPIDVSDRIYSTFVKIWCLFFFLRAPVIFFRGKLISLWKKILNFLNHQ